MNNLHLTTPPRLAMKRNENGDLVPNINPVTGRQDVSVAGKLRSIKPQPITYTREDGTEGTAYQGTTEIVNSKGDTQIVSVLINGKAIANVSIDEVYYVTARPSKDGLYTNYSQGDLLVMNANSADEYEALYASLMNATPVTAETPEIEQ